jgi:hypothetical protein
VLLACNKQDMGSKAHTVEFIRKRLERELDAVSEWGCTAAVLQAVPQATGVVLHEF